MEKTVIGVWGTANIGKSNTLIEVGRQLLRLPRAQTTHDIKGTDYHAIIDLNGILVGVQTFGDYPSAVEEGLQDFWDNGCHIIIIATKSYGGTVTAVENFSSDHDFRIVWGTTYRVVEAFTNLAPFNAQCANAYVSMIREIAMGRL